MGFDEVIGGFGLGLTSAFDSADLDSVFGATDETLTGEAFLSGEFLGDDEGVVEAALANMVTDGGGGDDDGVFW